MQNLPEGHNSLNPFVVVRGAAGFIDFVTQVFGATEVTALRIPDRDGRLIHAELRLGNATLMLADAKPGWPFTPALLQVYVEDAPGVVARAVARGGRVVTQPTPFYGGVLLARLSDPWGNLWWLYQPQAEAAPRLADTGFRDRAPSYVYTTLMQAMEQLAPPDAEAARPDADSSHKSRK